MDGESKDLKASDDKKSVLSRDPGATVSELNSEALASSKDSEQNEGKVSKAAPNSDKETFNKEEKQDEDVPEDFFDDFLKEDFMAGLDIVDEDDGFQEEESINKTPQKLSNNILTRSKIDHVKQFRQSPPGGSSRFTNKSKKNKKDKFQDELQKLDKELNEVRKAPLKRHKSTVDVDSFDIRRDPEKTRQAIQKDKIKSAKDKEKRLITDIIETGLVPPGMELEVDIEQVRQIGKKGHITDLREKIRSRRSRSKSVDRMKTSAKKRSSSITSSTSSLKKRRSRTPSRKTKKISVEINQSPLYSRMMHKSPIRRRSSIASRSPFLDRSPDRRGSPRRSIRSPNRSTIRRRSPPRSPTFRRRSRSRSPVNHRRSRSHDRLLGSRHRRDRSFSPLEIGRRKRSQSRSQKRYRKEEKVSFLEELVAKLNETHPSQGHMPPIAPPVNYMSSIPMVSHLTAPVPPVIPVVQQPPVLTNFFTAPGGSLQTSAVPATSSKYDPYDESFFIGNEPLNTLRSQQSQDFSNSSRTSQANGVSQYEANPNSGRDMDKLFGDQRIKLSDFLAITAKPQVSNTSPAKLQEKIKVIQRCQDAIRILNEKRFTGPLVVHKTDSYEYSKDMTISPLLRKPIVQLPFTTPAMKNSTEMDFTKCCETLLYRVGIDKRLDPMKVSEKSYIPPKEVAQKETPPVKSSYFETSAPVKVITKSLSTQTDKELSSCKECLRRKGILYANCGVQAGDPMLTFSVSTQVNEADFYSMIPKTKSLASLTPAQLLGKQSMLSDHKKVAPAFEQRVRNLHSQDVMPRTRQIPSPPPPPPIFSYPPLQSMQSQKESPYPPPLFSQPSLASLMQARNSMPPSSSFNDDRRGGYMKRF